jgi:phage-related protein (TIGR01555 family)
MGVFDKIKAGLGVVLSRADSYPPSATDPVRPSGSDVGWGWANAMTGMGYGATDPTAHTAFTRAPVLTAAEAWGLYEGDGLASRVVSLPATEALRQGWDVTWEGDEGASERVARWAAGLRIGPEERGLQVALSRWLMWRSIFGGSVIVLVCADGRPTSAPLDEVAPNLRQLRVLSRWDVQPTTYTQDPVTGQSLSAGDVWSVGAGAAHYHRSRLIFLGRGATPYSVPDLRQGWSASTYERIYSRLAACGTVDGAAARIVTSFTSPVQRMRGLAEALAQGGDAIIKRMGFEQMTRSLYRVTLLDADNESYENQTVSVAGLPELMDRFPERVAAATGIPLTLLQGHAPAGLSTDDQSGRRFFYDSIKATAQEQELRPALDRILTLAFASASGPTNGTPPPAWRLEFRPLYQLSELEQEELAGKRAQRDQTYITAGVLRADEVRQSRFAGASGDVTLTDAPPTPTPALA